MLIVEFILGPAAVWREHLVPGFCSRPKPKYQIQVKVLCFMKPLRMSLGAWRCPPCPDPADCSVSQHLNPGIVDVRQISTGNSAQTVLHNLKIDPQKTLAWPGSWKPSEKIILSVCLIPVFMWFPVTSPLPPEYHFGLYLRWVQGEKLQMNVYPELFMRTLIIAKAKVPSYHYVK